MVRNICLSFIYLFIFKFSLCKPSTPHITVAKSTPTTSRKDCSRPTSQPQTAYRECGSPIALPKSASFPSVTEYQKKLNSPIQVKYSPLTHFLDQV